MRAYVELEIIVDIKKHPAKGAFFMPERNASACMLENCACAWKNNGKCETHNRTAPIYSLNNKNNSDKVKNKNDYIV
jgi:hypothetical protein